MAGLLIVTASFAWIGVFIATGFADKTVPWCISLSLLAALASMHIVGTSQLPRPGSLPQIEESSPNRLWETFAASYLGFSLLMLGWLMITGVKPQPAAVAQRQFIDIELTSFADFENRNDPLPGTKEHDALRKRTGSTEKLEAASIPRPQPVPANARENTMETKESGNTAQVPVAQRSPASPRNRASSKSARVIAAKSESATESPTLPQEEPARLPDFKLPAGWKVFDAQRSFARVETSKISGLATPATRSMNEPLIMEEVAPIELFELADNDGETAIEVFQSGGRSKDGKGAPSTLQAYLKMLHQRIKRAWAPPKGDPRATEIIFRIMKSGKLSSIRLMRSSGSSDADGAAMRSVTACAPFRPLPDDYKMDYLDVRYTFNYRVDQLTETKTGE